jgi:hypothetical protein
MLLRDGRSAARRDAVLRSGHSTVRFATRRRGRYRAVVRDRSVGSTARTRTVTVA